MLTECHYCDERFLKTAKNQNKYLTDFFFSDVMLDIKDEDDDEDLIIDAPH